ncbi:Ig-like domain-containing protein [Mucilaginibacter puniceus]
MLSNKKSPFLPQLTLLFLAILLALGCAVPQKPQGGPKDVTPPKLLKATPVNETRNFSAKQITLEFDEYFRLVNQYQEINISPAQEKAPEVKIKGKNLVIDLKDTLLKETTYVINFGKAIADVNEGNTVKNFTYVFSTGNQIDSLKISGTVIDNLTLKKEKDVTVMLFPLSQDSLLFGKKKPSIYATTDTSGTFSLTNLHEGEYKLYALKETTGNKIYDNDDELIAFPGKTIRLTKDTANIKLSLFKQTPVKFRIVDRRFDITGKLFLSFNKSLAKPSLKIIDPVAFDAQKFVEFTKTLDSAYLYLRTTDYDSLKVAVLDNDIPIDTAIFRKPRKEAFKSPLTIVTSADIGNLLKPGTDLQIYTSTPITNRLPSLITLKENDTYVTNYTFIEDKTDGKHLSIRYNWKPNATYLLTFAEGALTGYFGEKNNNSPKRFKLDKPDNYSTLALKVTLPDTGRYYVVELLNEKGDATLRSDQVTKNTLLTYKNYPTGKYNVRVVYDTNRNGKWDTGSLKENSQPENIWVKPNMILLRPNYEPTEDLDIPKESTP